MQIGSQKLQSWRACAKNGAYLGLAILFVSMGSGCASTRKTTTTETTVTYSDEAAAKEGEQNKGVVVETSETTTTTTGTKPERPGVISSTFHAIGYVIALPFIIIGGLFRIIFGG